MKRIVAILLVVCLVVPAVFVPTEAASSKVITSEQIEKAISWGQTFLSPSDSSAFYGLCAAFVFHAYNEGAGISNSSYGTATAMGNALITHTDSNPPRGALVFWYVPDDPAGHVALSLGNGNIIHARGKKPYCVEIGTLKNVSNDHGASNYRGWGAPIAGYTLATESGTNAPALNASISVNDYMTYYATVTAMDCCGKVTVTSAQSWKLPWTDSDNANLKGEKISGSIILLAKIQNHAGKVWYEYKTLNGERRFIYSDSVEVYANHKWVVGPKCLSTCENCGSQKSGGVAHSYKPATCTEPKICTVCETTAGEALGHKWTGTTKTCSLCKKSAEPENSCISPEDYLKTFCRVFGKEQLYSEIAIPKNGNSVQTWKLPWTNSKNGVQDNKLKSKMISGNIQIKALIENHVGNVWYEYETGENTRGFISASDLLFLPKYTVNLDANGGKCDVNTMQVYANNAYNSLPKPTRDGYIFDGWFTKKDGGSKISERTVMTVNTDHTLYAHWSARKYTIQFDARGGNCETAKKTVMANAAYGELPVPKRNGFRFVNWLTSRGAVVTKDSKQTVNKDHTLYADWVKLTETQFSNQTISQEESSRAVLKANLTIGTDATVSSYGFSLNKTGGTKTNYTLVNGVSLTNTNREISVILGNYSTLQPSTTYNYTLWAKDSSGRLIVETTAASFTTKNCTHSSYDAEGICTNCGTKYSWMNSFVSCDMILFPQKSGSSIILKDKPYSKGRECSDPLSFAHASGYVTNHYGNRWYVVVNDNVRRYVYSGDVTNNVAVESVSIQVRSANVPIGYEFNTSVFVTPSNAANRAVVWSTSNSDVATVADGYITAVGVGTATITATSVSDSSKKGTCIVTVSAPAPAAKPEAVYLDAEQITLTVEDTYTLTAGFVPCDPDNTAIIWNSSNPKVATVNNGQIQPLDIGSTVITATSVADPSLTDSCMVYVDIISIDSVTISAAGGLTQIKEGDMLQFTAKVFPDNAYWKKIIWTLEENGVQGSTHATISESGLLTALSPGEVTVLANYAGGAAKYDLTIVEGSGTAERIMREAIADREWTGSNVYFVDKSITLTSDLTIPENYSLEFENGGALIIPQGITLTNKGALYIDDGTVILSGTIDNQAEVYVHQNGLLESVGGHFQGNPVELYTISNGKIIGDITVNKIYPPEEQGLRNAIAFCSSGSTVMCSNTLSITEDLVIPAGIKVFLYTTTDSTSITIPQGVTLVVEGELRILTSSGDKNAELVVEGTLVNNGNIKVDGEESSLRLSDNGTFQGSDVFLDNGGTASTGVPAINLKSLVRSITTDPQEIEGYRGDTFQITPFVLPANATNQSLSWKSSDENVAIVYQDGSVMITGSGSSAVITATATDGSGVYAEIQVTALQWPYLASGTWGAEGDNISWTLWADGVLRFYGSGEMLETDKYSPQWASSYYRDMVKNVEIEEGITSIGYEAFYLCKNLESIHIPESVEKIGTRAFSYCSGLKEILLPAGLQSVGVQAFYNCSSLDTVILPDGIKEIDDYAFSGCAGLTTFTVPASVTQIGERIFESCTGLEDVIIACKGEAIGGGLFYGCTNLKSIDFLEDIESVNEAMFLDCDRLTSFSIPNTVKSVGRMAFWGSGIESVQIPSSVCAIHESAFDFCESLTDIYYEGTEEKWQALQYESPAGVTVHTNDFPDYAINIYAEDVSELTSGEQLKLLAEFAPGNSTNTSIGWTLSEKDQQYAVITGEWNDESQTAVAMLTAKSVSEVNMVEVIARSADGKAETGSFFVRIKPRTVVEHKYSTSVTPPTCTEDGYTTYLCFECGDSFVSEPVPMLGHDWGDADCNAPATCGRCGTSTGSALGHDWKTATCTDPKTCKRCGTAEGASLGHDWKEANCSDPKTCNRCGTATGSALGHSWVDANCLKPKTCSRCKTTTGGLGDHGYENGSCIFCGQGADDAVIRLYGSDRFDTAFTVANEMKDNLGVEKFSTVIVASGKDFADALSASYLAAVNKAPILLSYKSNQNRQVADYIRGNLAEGGLVYIIGGTSAVPVEMEDLLSGLRVKRLAGENRFETNLAVLKEAGIPAGEEILVCTGSDFADCLSAAAAGKPIMLVYKRLMDSQKAYIPTLNNRFCIIGGTNAVNSTVEDFINDYGATTRLAGNHRYETSVMVAQKYFGSPDGAVLAYARNFPDGLCGGVLAATAGMPLVLTDSKYYSYAADYTAEKGIRGGYVLGGEALISGKAAGAVLGG